MTDWFRASLSFQILSPILVMSVLVVLVCSGVAYAYFSNAMLKSMLKMSGKTKAQRIRSYGLEAAILTLLYTVIDVLSEMFGSGAVLRLNVFRNSKMDLALSVAAGFAVTFLVLALMDCSICENILKSNSCLAKTAQDINE